LRRRVVPDGIRPEILTSTERKQPFLENCLGMPFLRRTDMTKGFLTLLGAALLGMFAPGCSPMRYSKNTGKSTFWTTSVGTMAETAYAIPVYRGPPERPYEVIGSVRFVDPRKYWDDGIIRMAASTGKKHGGNAIYIPSFGAPGSWLDSFISRPAGYDQETKAYVIKFIPETVVQSRKAEQDRFWTAFRVKNPKLADDDQLLQLGTSHLTDQGVLQNSTQMEEQLSVLLSDIKNQPKNDLSGKWLFKGSVQTRSLTAADSPEPFFGVASIAMTGSKITILSTAGKVEVSFSGSVETGQIVGTLGLGARASSLSLKCEGVALNDKISFAFQKLVESGTVQGNLTFLR